MSKQINKMTASQAEREGLLPTPIVGAIVHWYQGANSHNAPAAAIVTKVEAVGRVQLEIFAPTQFSPRQLLDGVHHISDPKHAKGDFNTINHGGWDFVPDYDAHEFAIKDRDRREMAKLEAEERAEKAKAQREKKESVAV